MPQALLIYYFPKLLFELAVSLDDPSKGDAFPFTTAKEHARLRTGIEGYGLDPILDELILLQRVILDALSPLDEDTRRIVDRFFQHVFKEAAKEHYRILVEASRVDENHLQAILDQARCILLSAEVTRDEVAGESRLLYTPLRFDGAAALRILPLDLAPGENFFEGWRRLREPSENELYERAVQKMEFNDGDVYRQEFRVTDRFGQGRWMHEEITVQTLEPHRWRLVGIITDVTLRKTNEEEIQYIAAHAHCILWSARVTDHEGRLVWDTQVSDLKAAQGVLALDIPEGATYTDVMFHRRHPDDTQEVDERGIAAIRGGLKSYTQEYRVYDKFGALKWLREEITIQPLSPMRWRVVGVSMDISDRKRIEMELKEAGRYKDQFLAVLGHELRNPLGAMTNTLFVQRLKNQGNMAVQHSCDLMERQIKQMLRLVDDLRDVTRMRRDKLPLRKKALDLNTLMEQSIEALRPAFGERRHELRLDFAPSPLLIEADPERLSQVITNLLDNAAKYTDPGGEITVSTQRTDSTVHFAVRDSGMGIEPSQLSRVFDFFVQADRALANSNGGLGIGLALVKGLVELHGGEVSVFSEGLGRGSEFCVSLPALQGETTADATGLEAQDIGPRLSRSGRPQ
jgi:signal transduction histidine kinase